MGLKYEEAFEDWEIRIAKGMVGRFIAKWACLGEDDFDSLVGECLVQWLIAKPTYDASRGSSEETYMATVVHNKLRDLVRERTSVKYRIISEGLSLDQERMDKDEGDLTLLETIDSSTVPDAPPDPLAAQLLKEDLSRILPGLTYRQRRLCDLLGARKSKKAIAKTLRINRDTVYAEIERIQKIFEKAELGKRRK